MTAREDRWLAPVPTHTDQSDPNQHDQIPGDPMTVFTENATTFSTRATDAVTWQRNDGVHQALLALTGDTSYWRGDPPARVVRRDGALHVLLRSVHRQMQLEGHAFPYPLLVAEIVTAQWLPCPDCDGQGEVLAAGDTTIVGNDPQVRLMSCGRCDGFGSVTGADLDDEEGDRG